MTSAPANPIATAIQRCNPTRSRSSGTARAVTMIGAVNITEDAVARSTNGRAVMKQTFATKKMSERTAWVAGRAVRRIANPRRGQKKSIIQMTCPRKRAHTTCHTG